MLAMLPWAGRHPCGLESGADANTNVAVVADLTKVQLAAAWADLSTKIRVSKTCVIQQRSKDICRPRGLGPIFCCGNEGGDPTLTRPVGQLWRAAPAVNPDGRRMPPIAPNLVAPPTIDPTPAQIGPLPPLSWPKPQETRWNRPNCGRTQHTCSQGLAQIWSPQPGFGKFDPDLVEFDPDPVEPRAEPGCREGQPDFRRCRPTLGGKES